MTKEPRSEHKTKSAPHDMAAEFSAMGKKRMEEFARVQTELLDQMRQANQQWMERLQYQTNLASKLAAQLATVHSVPEAMSIYREWTSQQLEMMANDGKHLLEDTQKLIGTTARLLSNGWMSNWTGVST
ncbi:MAG: phasin family protein [Xanthobacteraceae bacterium]